MQFACQEIYKSGQFVVAAPTYLWSCCPCLWSVLAEFSGWVFEALMKVNGSNFWDCFGGQGFLRERPPGLRLEAEAWQVVLFSPRWSRRCMEVGCWAYPTSRPATCGGHIEYDFVLACFIDNVFEQDGNRLKKLDVWTGCLCLCCHRW